MKQHIIEEICGDIKWTLDGMDIKETIEYLGSFSEIDGAFIDALYDSEEMGCDGVEIRICRKRLETDAEEKDREDTAMKKVMEKYSEKQAAIAEIARLKRIHSI